VNTKTYPVANHQTLHRVTASTVVTRALLTWTQQQECFWLLHLYASHLYTLDGAREWFTCLNITVRDHAARIVIEDGDGNTLTEQHVDFTDFGLVSAKLFAVWQEPYWVILLPSDY
jgi:hypothetical protein